MTFDQLNQRPKSFYWIYPPLRFLVYLVLLIFGPCRGIGAKSVPRTGGVLLFANHLSDIDPIIVHCFSPRPIYFMSKSELFEIKVLGPMIRYFRAFPVKRGEPDKAAIKTAVDLLKSGHVVCIFPEGKLSEDGNLQPLLPGVSLIARMAGVPVQCCGLKNTHKIMPYGLSIPRPALRWVTAHFGEPRSFTKADSGDEILEWATTELKNLVS